MGKVHYLKDHPRNAEIIRRNGGTLVAFRDLPKTHQFALIHYMSVDGAAWAVQDDWPDWEWGEGAPCPTRQADLRAKSMADVERFHERFVEAYGNVKFGIVDVPTQELIEAIRQDQDFPSDEADEYYKKSEVTGTDAGWEYDQPTWPVIFSPFDNETLQDGWTRFSRYCEIGAETVPCVYYRDNFNLTPGMTAEQNLDFIAEFNEDGPIHGWSPQSLDSGAYLWSNPEHESCRLYLTPYFEDYNRVIITVCPRGISPTVGEAEWIGERLTASKFREIATRMIEAEMNKGTLPKQETK